MHRRPSSPADGTDDLSWPLPLAAARIVAVFAATIVAITILLGKAVTLAAARCRAPAQAPAVPRERTWPGPDGSA